MSTILYGIIQKDSDQVGTDIFRSKDTSLPMAYRATLEHTVRVSSNGNNLNQTVEAITPVTRTVDGLVVSTDAFKATLKFSALQHIVEDDKRFEAFDLMIDYAIANRTDICYGRRPSSSADLSVDTTVPV